jgi:hypothetical protein
VRKSFSGNRELAFEYIGAANTQLMILKNAMKLGGLKQAVRTINYPDGTEIVIASIFGQDYVSINSPTVGSVGSNSGKGIEHGKDEFNPKTIEKIIHKIFGDFVHTTGSITITITRNPPPTIYIGGGSSDGKQASYYSSDFGFVPLGLRNSFNNPETSGVVYAMAADGSFPSGSVYVYDSTINPVTVNPFTGQGGQPFGYKEHACVWRSGTHSSGDADVSPWNNITGPGYSRVCQVSVGGGSCSGNTATGGGFTWNGRSNTALTLGRPAVPQGQNATGVVISGSTYRVDGGPSVTWAPPGKYATCSVRVNHPQTVSTIVISE